MVMNALLRQGLGET